MKQRTRARLWPLLAALAAACGPGGDTNDAGDTGTTTDTGHDTGTDAGTDVPIGADVADSGLDATVDTGVDAPAEASVDAGSEASADGGVCLSVPIENLGALGTPQGGVLHYTGSNASSTATPTQGLQIPSLSGLINFCSFKSGHQRVFSYTTQTTSVLRVSTSNPGTSYGFDTTIIIVDTACTSQRRYIGCNDDDLAFDGDQRRISSTASTFVEVQAGHTVYIAVGGFVPVSGGQDNPEGETGTFELTVEELAPKADGDACDVRRLQDACADGTTCVTDGYPSEQGHCRADGSVAGAACVAGACTGAGLTCDTTNGVCVDASVASGGTCDPYHSCTTGFDCFAPQRGAPMGTCVPEGSAVGTACGAGGTCASGLVCTVAGGPGVCLRAATANGPCSTFDSQCPAGQSCVGGENLGTAGTCTNVGTVAGSACDATMMCSGSGLACTTQGAATQCTDTVASGGTCAFFDVCANSGTCYLTNPTERIAGECFAPGSLGGACRPTGTPCDAGTCSNGRCVTAGTLGGTCDLTTECPAGSSCLRSGSGAFMGSCVAAGTVAGALCRGTGMACDNGLTCSSDFTGDGVCQNAATSACDPLTATLRCPSNQVCRATSLASGQCAAPVAATEPNDVPSTSLAPLTVPAAVEGSLTTADIDCFAVNVPANGKLFAAASSPAGLCPGLLQLDVYRLNGATLELVGSDQDSSTFGCPRVDGADPSPSFAWARGLSAGTYYACLRDQNGNPHQGYVLSLNATP